MTDSGPLVAWDRDQQTRAPYRLWLLVLLATGALVAATVFQVPTALSSFPPSGRAAVVPEAPAGRTIHLAPLGDFSEEGLASLAAFYDQRYGVSVRVLAAGAVQPEALDRQRGQVIGERLVDGLRLTYVEAGDANALVIGVTTADIYLAGVPQWSWAFGMRQGNRLAVVSTARMESFGPFADLIERARLRKLLTKYVATMYFGLPTSEDPKSVLYDNILGPADLDRMGEDFI